MTAADPRVLLDQLVGQFWIALDDAVNGLAQPLTDLQPLAGAGDPTLQGKLLDPLTLPGSSNALLGLMREVLGDLPNPGPVRWHGWQREPGARRGLAAVLSDGTARAVLAASPGPVVDLFVTPGAALAHDLTTSTWQTSGTVSTPVPWRAEWRPGEPSVAAGGTANLSLTRDHPVQIGPPAGPGVSWRRLRVSTQVRPGSPVALEVTLAEFAARVLPQPLMDLLGEGRPSTPTDLVIILDRAGLRFRTGAVRWPLQGGLDLPGLEARGLGVELTTEAGHLQLKPSTALTARLPALPVRMSFDGVGVAVPLTIDGTRIGVDSGALRPALPDGIGIELTLPPVSGGGFLRVKGDEYAGILDVDLGVFQVQAMGLLTLPNRDRRDLSMLVLLSGAFPPPGVQLGFGFALDAVGGLLGINHRVDAERLRTLVSDGNADRVMFPENALARADQILDSLRQSFPVAAGRQLVGPMLQLNWGGRIVKVSLAVVLELPDPVRVILLGRLTVGIPDPVVPLIRLQASLFGRIDPGVPMLEVQVSLTGSYVAGIPITGDLYALFRGGRDAVFVLSAGGFHPRFVRPAGVPALRRLSMDLGGGLLRLRGEAYLALTSNSLQFGALIHLDATIAGCGVEGYLGLDALFVWEPVLAFSVQVQAGVAVRAFGRRLASVALRFTLEGPGAWHAFGTGSISVLWWDVDLDFDVRWGTPPELTPRPPALVDAVRNALGRPQAWSIAAPASARSPIRLAPWAAREVASGSVALPESGLRLSQEIVPLDIAFNRFHRVAVPEQTWKLVAVRLNPNRPTPPGRKVTAAFAPGEFFGLSDDEQLSRPAFEQHRSGAELSEATVQPTQSRDADQRYETKYEVDDAWFPSEPSKPPRFTVAVADARLEVFARPLSATERLDRWRVAQRAVNTEPLVRLR